MEDKHLSARFLLELDDAKSNPTLLNYRIRSETNQGEWNVEPVVYPVKVIPDLAPEVQIASQLPDQIDLPANQSLDLEVRALDPDFGLAKLSMAISVNGQKLPPMDLFQDPAGVRSQISETYRFDPRTLNLRPGHRIEITAIAQDNRHAPGGDEYQPNVRQSRTIQLQSSNPKRYHLNRTKPKNLPPIVPIPTIVRTIQTETQPSNPPRIRSKRERTTLRILPVSPIARKIQKTLRKLHLRVPKKMVPNHRINNSQITSSPVDNNLVDNNLVDNNPVDNNPVDNNLVGNNLVGNSPAVSSLEVSSLEVSSLEVSSRGGSRQVINNRVVNNR